MRTLRPLLSVCLALSCGVAAAQEADTAELLGFPGEASADQRALEDRFVANLDTTNLSNWLRDLSAKPHPGGSEAGLQVANYIAEKYREWGFDVRIETVFGLAPTPGERIVEMIAPMTYKPKLEEHLFEGFSPKRSDGMMPPFNAYSLDGEVTAPAVYANLGLDEDYKALAGLDIDVRGKIVIVRVGRAFRGTKARLAGEWGAAGVILFPDPADVGYALGPTYPYGPYLPETGYQQGSVMNVPLRPGDPLSPFTGSKKPPKSYSLEDAEEVISPVPILPVSASDIRPILESMSGQVAPAEWQGALPITYRLDGDVVVKLKVAQNWRIAAFHNVIATIKGSEWPEEWIIHGNNHDSWGFGALVAQSGLVAQMEEARSIAKLMETGWRPKRTLVFAAWDGEEHGLVGSTEWVETREKSLRRKAIAYINTGVNARGFLSAGGSHSLETLINEVAGDVRDPVLGVSIYERKTQQIHESGSSAERQHLEGTGRILLEPLGLGSDQTPFLHHMGIPTVDLGFGGEAPSGIYHSLHDNFDSFGRFADPGFRYGLALAETAGRTMLRLANVDVLPFDFEGEAEAIALFTADISDQLSIAPHCVGQTHSPASVTQIRNKKTSLDDDIDSSSVKTAPLELATAMLHASADRFDQAREAFEMSGAMIKRSKLARLNRVLSHAEGIFAPQDGLPGRPWYRHQLYAPDIATGYGATTLPAVQEAIERCDWATAQAEVETIAKLTRDYAASVDEAAAILVDATPN